MPSRRGSTARTSTKVGRPGLFFRPSGVMNGRAGRCGWTVRLTGLLCVLACWRGADGKPDYAICQQVFQQCLEDHSLFGQILAPHTQALGLQTGWLFDPDRMQAMVDNKVSGSATGTAAAPQLLAHLLLSSRALVLSERRRGASMRGAQALLRALTLYQQLVSYTFPLKPPDDCGLFNYKFISGE